MWRYGVLFRAPLGQIVRMKLIQEIFFYFISFILSFYRRLKVNVTSLQ